MTPLPIQLPVVIRWTLMASAVIAGIAMITAGIPWYQRLALASRQQTDQDHLKRMWQTYLNQSQRGGITPRSRGYRFWLALFVGDSSDSSGGYGRYFDFQHVGLLCSPQDWAAEPRRVERAIWSASFQHPIAMLAVNEFCCSYAGPRDRAFSVLSAGSADPERRLSRTIVGTTGTRDGVGLYPAHIVVLYADLTTEVVELEPGRHGVPDWATAEFSTVADVGVELPLASAEWHRWPRVYRGSKARQVEPPTDGDGPR